MNLKQTRLVTDDVQRLTKFYEGLTGATAEIIARVATEGFHLLDAAPARINAKDTPIPYHPNLWNEHRPNAKSIAAKARQILAE